MNPYFDTYLAASPADTKAAQLCGCPLVHVAYGVGPSFLFLKSSIGASMRGGLMSLSDEKYDSGDGDITKLARELVRECVTRGYEGVVFDFEGPVDKRLEAFSVEAGTALAARGLRVYTYPPYADCCPDARVILQTAMVSGRLNERLALARTKYPGHRLCVEMERLARDITLPDPTGTGVALSQRALNEIVQGRQVFYSNEMAAHYFTYKDQTGQTHFVIFDDAYSFKEKIHTAIEAGIHESFMIYPDIKDIWGELKAMLG